MSDERTKKGEKPKREKKILTTLPYILIYINAGGHVTA